MFELQQLRQFIAVAECGTLSAAAKTLHLSQPALTRSMQQLEEALSAPLFDRKKNKIELNDTGRLAVEQARQVLNSADTMAELVRVYARSRSTVTIGSCAPGPMWLLTPELTGLLPDHTIAAELHPREELIEGLLDRRYQLVILDAPEEREGILCRRYVTERLFLSLPSSHPLAGKRDEGIWLSELAGQTMLLFSNLGIWENICAENMRDIHFIIQRDKDALFDLVSASSLPVFSTNLTQSLAPIPDRVNVPIRDSDASITFYLCAAETEKKLLDRIQVRV